MLFVLLTVRDAAARLPNGEGTRAEICELLKDSQYLASDVTNAQVWNIRFVSGVFKIINVTVYLYLLFNSNGSY